MRCTQVKRAGLARRAFDRVFFRRARNAASPHSAGIASQKGIQRLLLRCLNHGPSVAGRGGGGGSEIGPDLFPDIRD